MLTYFQRCKGLGYGLRTVRTPVGPRRNLWQAWFPELPDGMVIPCASQYTREEACRKLWWKAVATGLTKE